MIKKISLNQFKSALKKNFAPLRLCEINIITYKLTEKKGDAQLKSFISH